MNDGYLAVIQGNGRWVIRPGRVSHLLGGEPRFVPWQQLDSKRLGKRRQGLLG